MTIQEYKNHLIETIKENLTNLGDTVTSTHVDKVYKVACILNVLDHYKEEFRDPYIHETYTSAFGKPVDTVGMSLYEKKN